MSGLAVVGTSETGMVDGGFSEALRPERSAYRVNPSGRCVEDFREVCQDGIMAPCVSLLVEGCGTAVENVMDCTGSRVAEGTTRVSLDLPSAEVDRCWETVNSCSNHE